LDPLADDPVLRRPLSYNLFARWAAPLNTNMRRLREKVQEGFLAAATIGGGGKDFGRAFLRIDTNGDGVMSVAEFKAALGPLVARLTPYEMDCLTDYFDADGNGTIDFKEFLGMFGTARGGEGHEEDGGAKRSEDSEVEVGGGRDGDRLDEDGVGTL
jgi:hypothetical protein